MPVDCPAPADPLFQDFLFPALRLVAHPASLADPAHQALGADAEQRRGDHKGLDAHVGETGDRARRIVRVQRAHEQVTRERRLHRDIRRLLVSNFAHEDDVGVLPEKRAQRRGEGEADLPVHLHLVDAHQRVFDRVLGRADDEFRRVDLVQRRVERHRLARAGRAAVQDHAVGLADHLAVADQRLLGETEGRQRQRGLLLVEDTHDHAFAVVERRSRDAEIEVEGFLGELLENDAPVLRQAPLGNIEVAHDLDARDQCRRDLGGQAELFLAQAVDAVADNDLVLLRLDVDVARSRKVRVLDDPVGQLDDRAGLLVHEFVVAGLDHRAELRADLLHDVVEARRAVVLPLVELVADVLLAAKHPDHAEARHLVDLHRHRHLEGIREHHQQQLADGADRDHQVFLAELPRNALIGGGRDAIAGDVVGCQAERAGLCHENLKRRDPVFLLQQAVERVAVQVGGHCGDDVPLPARKPVHLHQLGDDLGLDFSEGHGVSWRPRTAAFWRGMARPRRAWGTASWSQTASGCRTTACQRGSACR